MPDRNALAVGDSIRILSVPAFDFEPREKTDQKDRLLTATVLEGLIKNSPMVVIDQIDEYGNPWFTVRLGEAGDFEQHSLALMEDHSWETVYRVSSNNTPPQEHQIATLRQQIDQVMLEHEEAYAALEAESEKLYDQQETLKKKYAALDRKTELNTLFEKLGELM